jgi:hypothetical protein
VKKQSGKKGQFPILKKQTLTAEVTLAIYPWRVGLARCNQVDGRMGKRPNKKAERIMRPASNLCRA